MHDIVLALSKADGAARRLSLHSIDDVQPALWSDADWWVDADDAKSMSGMLRGMGARQCCVGPTVAHLVASAHARFDVFEHR